MFCDLRRGKGGKCVNRHPCPLIAARASGAAGLLLVAVTFGLASCGTADDSEAADPTGAGQSGETEINLPTSNFIIGEGGFQAGIDGVLAIDDSDCIYLDANKGPLYVLWPKGYSAWASEQDGSREISLFDDSQDLVATVGTRVRAAGGYSTDPPPPLKVLSGVECLPQDTEIAYVQSEVRTVP